MSLSDIHHASQKLTLDTHFHVKWCRRFGSAGGHHVSGECTRPSLQTEQTTSKKTSEKPGLSLFSSVLLSLPVIMAMFPRWAFSGILWSCRGLASLSDECDKVTRKLTWTNIACRRHALVRFCWPMPVKVLAVHRSHVMDCDEPLLPSPRDSLSSLIALGLLVPHCASLGFCTHFTAVVESKTAEKPRGMQSQECLFFLTKTL